MSNIGVLTTMVTQGHDYASGLEFLFIEGQGGIGEVVEVD
jgi:hypothetical protein